MATITSPSRGRGWSLFSGISNRNQNVKLRHLFMLLVGILVYAFVSIFWISQTTNRTQEVFSQAEASITNKMSTTTPIRTEFFPEKEGKVQKAEEEEEAVLAIVNTTSFQRMKKFVREHSATLRKEKKTDGEQEEQLAKTIAYAISITGCQSGPSTILDSAIVLKHSIHLSSIHGPKGGRYDYQIYAIYHPTAESCALPLGDVGYTLLKRNTLVAVEDIQSDFVRTAIVKNGCCGEKELIKLEAYTLLDHPLVVHLDLDVIVLKPLDKLFDVMLLGPTTANITSTTNLEKLLMFPKEPIPDTINAAFTHDYGMMNRKKDKPVQGGFIVIKPNRSVYEQYQEIVRIGDFRPLRRGGWGGVMGPFWGAMTIQGLIPYYYTRLYRGQSIELNRCVYNNMCDNPRNKRTVDDVVHGDCLTGETDCEDCRARPIEDVVTTHFTICQKPWNCLPHLQNAIQHRLCQKVTKAWYTIRHDFETNILNRTNHTGKFHPEIFYGYCSKRGESGYIPITSIT